MATVSNNNNNHTETYFLDATVTRTNQLREPSFSSYLNASEQNFVRKLVAPASTQPNGLSSFSFNPQEDEEIEVFEAERYFNGAMDPADQSSNSQCAFLGRSVRDHHRKKSNRRSFLLAALGCKCYCSDGGSVDVFGNNDEVAPATSTKTRTTTEISSPSLKSHNNYPAVSSNPRISEEMMMQRQKHETFHQGFATVKAQTSPKQEENPRKSLEVFGSSPSSSCGNMESFLTMGQKTNPRTISGEMNSDSDASSDLFEIESLTGSTNNFSTGKGDSYLTTRTSDATSDLYPTAPRYAPSEASIEWSVVTTSPANFSALMSDFKEMNNLSSHTYDMKLRQQQVMNPKKADKNDGDVHRRLSSGSFLRCKSQKAVEVVGDAFRSVSRRFRGEERQLVDSRQLHRSVSDLGFSDARARFQPGRDKACSRFDLMNGGVAKIMRKT